ncbi:MAG: response regulator [Candidatus Obscuribacterales bacterium]|nr:response regulator [Candidatus Obscuribacterales bacterium]
MPDYPYKILVAEDHPVNQKVAGLLLNSLGFDYMLVQNGRQAVEAITTGSRPSAILMDIMMPEMDGFEAAHKIRQFEFASQRNIPIIACTAVDEKTIREQCIAAGMNDYLAKPLSRAMLKSRLEYWLNIEIKTVSDEPANANDIKSITSEPLDRAYLNVLYGIDQLDDILDLYLIVTEALIDQLSSSVQTQKAPEVKRIAHEIKSGSYSVSAKEIATLCRDLEIAGEKEAWTEVTKIHAALFLSFGKVREFISQKALVEISH